MTNPDRTPSRRIKDAKNSVSLAIGGASLVVLSLLAGRACAAEKTDEKKVEVYLPLTASDQHPTRIPTVTSVETVFPTATATGIPTATATKEVSPTPTNTPLPEPTFTPTLTPTLIPPETEWSIKSVSTMNQSKDRVCDPRSPEWIAQWVHKMSELGITHVGVETPYDNPRCNGVEGNYSIEYTQEWLTAIRAQKSVDGQPLHVWHRHMPIAFEGIYDTIKDPTVDYASLIADYIKNNPSFFKDGDVFTIIPEPQNGGVVGATGCGQDVCIFSSVEEFKTFLIDATNQAKKAFLDIGVKNITFACCGFDGYFLWGDNNPDHAGTSFLDPETVKQLGILTIDHYPAKDATMAEDLKEMRVLWPANEYPVLIGEWGAINSLEEKAAEDVTETMNAFEQDKNIVGVQYWQGGPAGNEGLIHNSFAEYPHFAAVKAAFTK